MFVNLKSYILIVSIFMHLGINNARAQSMKLVWCDEFETDGLPDSTRWSYNVGNGCPNICGWGNNELQYYTTKRLKNARVEKGRLIIEVHKESIQDRNYSSARLVTKGKGDWQYGKIEVMAKLPYGVGTWPAIWMLPSLPDGTMKWPRDGEIDIMEHVGYNQNMIFATIHTAKYNHTNGTQKGDSIKIINASQEMHLYAISWDKERIIWSVDGAPFFELPKNNENVEGWPFDAPFHLIVNIAVGGNWGGKYGVDDTIWPQKMELDFIRVYQSDSY